MKRDQIYGFKAVGINVTNLKALSDWQCHLWSKSFEKGDNDKAEATRCGPVEEYYYPVYTMYT